MEKEKKSQEQTLIFLNKYYKAIIFGMALIILAGGYFLAVNKSILALKQKRLTLTSEKVQELEHAASYFKKLEELSKIIDNFQKENDTTLAKLEQILPKNAQIPELIAQIEALIKSNGFNLDSLAIAESEPAAKKSAAQKRKPAADAEDSESTIAETKEIKSAAPALPAEVKSLKLSLAVSGKDYFTFKELLKNIEQHIRIFDVTSLSFGGGTGQGSYSLNLITYYFENK